MTVFEIALLFVAGILCGAINAVAGGGTFISFGALTLLGVPPISANATSSIVQLPGYVTSTLAYWRLLRQVWRGTIAFVLVSAVGALLGALILLWLSNARFASLVPWLLLAATALFAVGPWLKPKARSSDTDEPASSGARGPAVQFFTSIYGGFFGAGMGIMMLATLGLTERGDYHYLNALKNLLANVIAIAAVVVFVSGGVVSWPGALAMIPGVALGGFSGVWIARRVPQIAIRLFVIAIGLLLAGYYFWKG